MISSKQAALVSGLVLPGLGQWLRGERPKAVVMMGSVLVLFGALTVRVFLLLYHFMTNLMILDQPGLSPLEQFRHEAVAGTWYLVLPLAIVWVWSVADLLRETKEKKI